MTVPDHHINNNDVLLLPLEGIHAHNLSSDNSISSGTYDFSNPGEIGQTSQLRTSGLGNTGSSSTAFHDQQKKLEGFGVNTRPQPPEDLTNVFEDMLDTMGAVDELTDTFKIYPPENTLSTPHSNLRVHQEPWHKPLQQLLPKVYLASDQHPGNNRFYIHISLKRRQFMQAYNSGDEAKCNEIAEEIINNICFQSNPRGRFLKYDPLSTEDDWIHIGRGQPVVDQVKGALKDPPIVRLSKFGYHELERPSPEKSLGKRMTPSNEIVSNTDFSRTLSSYRDESSYRESHLSSTVIGTSRRDTSNMGTSYRDAHSQVDTEVSVMSTSNMTEDTGRTGAGSETQKRRKGMRRRGMISSDLPTRSKRFDVNGELTQQVESVFNQPQEIGANGYAESECSENSYQSVEKSKRVKHNSAIAPSYASSTTSSISGLHSDFANGLKFEGNRSAASSRHYSRSSNFKRKKSAGANRERASTIIPEYFNGVQVQVFHESTGTFKTRSLSSYDILCTQNRTSILPVNQIGNNRFRIILLMYHGRYYSEKIKNEEKNCILYSMYTDILNTKKGKMRFIYQDQNNNDMWTQMENQAIPKFITACLKEANSNPDIMKLPSIKEKPWVSVKASRRRRKQVKFDDLQQAALKNVQTRRRKKQVVSRDPEKIAELHEAVVSGSRTG